jgi:DNA-directed RNA polymerase specialized sigma24 family protein
LLDLCSRPETFDPSRHVPLDRFIAQAAWRNIRDILRGEKRRKVREEKAEEFSGNNLVELPSPVANSEESVSQREQQQTDELMRTLDNPMDRKILELKLAGVRRTEEFARVLGVNHLSVAEQRQAVKRAKDRIDVHLKRKVKGAQ